MWRQSESRKAELPCRYGKVLLVKVLQTLSTMSIALRQDVDKKGANDRDRTGDLVLTMDALYQLSYIGIVCIR